MAREQALLGVSCWGSMCSGPLSSLAAVSAGGLLSVLLLEGCCQCWRAAVSAGGLLSVLRAAVSAEGWCQCCWAAVSAGV